jgi:general secretion pathway protein I
MNTHPMSPACPAGQGGFTLLEVLVAVVILAVAMGALIKVGSENAANAAYLRDRTHAHWVGMNLLTRYRIGMEPRQIGSREGTSEMGERTWYWRATVSESSVDVEGFTLGGLLRVEVEVRDRDDRDREPLARVVGFIL